MNEEKKMMTLKSVPKDLSVNDVEHPLNLDSDIAFSWKLTSKQRNLFQQAYQIQVCDANDKLLWDTDKVMSDQQAHINYNGQHLKMSSDYQWRVRVWYNDNTMTDWSETAYFGTGLHDSDWSGAEWLTRDLENDELKDDQWSLFRKSIVINRPTMIRSVRAYVAAVHTYDLYIDGHRIEQGQSFSYPGEGYYQAIDLTKFFKTNKVIGMGVILHYYGAGQGRAGSQAGLLVKLVIDYTDGTSQLVTSDKTWKTLRGPFIKSNLRNGEGDHVEFQDGQNWQKLGDWSSADYDDSNWQKCRLLGPHPSKPFTKLIEQETRLIEKTIFPVSVVKLKHNVTLVDFGKVIAAKPSVHFKQGIAGNKVVILAGYRLNDSGTISTTKLETQDTDMSFPYIQGQGEQQYTAFTHLGFRYLQIDGTDEDFDEAGITAVTVQRDFMTDHYAHFNSSDPILNKVWWLLHRSIINGIQETFVDTPTREKGQFLVDAANISYGSLLTVGERATTKQALLEFVNSQHRYWTNGDDAGRYNAVYPNGDGKRDIPDYTELFPDWLWQYYWQSGDLKLLQKVYPALRATADYIIRHISTESNMKDLIVRLSGGEGGGPYRYGIIDWPVQGRFGYDMATVARSTVNALGVCTLNRVADVAEAVGQPKAEVAYLRTVARRITQAMNQFLRRQDGLFVDGLLANGKQSAHVSQHANSYAIAFNIVSEDDKSMIAQWLSKQGMRQGPMTVHWLLKALGETGNTQAVIDLLTNPNDFGWAKVIADGGTFSPESWVLSGDANSESHGWGAQAIVDIVNYIVGINISAVGAKQLNITIPSNTKLTNASGSIYTQVGLVSCEWEKNISLLHTKVVIPVNTTATITIPCHDNTQIVATTAEAKLFSKTDNSFVYQVGSGEWKFTEK